MEKVERFIKHRFIIMLFMFIGIQLNANERSYSFLHFTNESGLPSSYVKSITQDQFGFIWLATRISVSRFDGMNYQSFPTFNKNGEEIEIFSNLVFMFSDSLLITRTNEGKYYFFDQSNECFRPYQLLNNLGVVQKIVPTDDGYWVCQSNEIYYINALTKKQVNFNEICLKYKLPARTEINDILYRDNLLFAYANDEKILQFNLEKETLLTYNVTTKLDNNTLVLDYIDFENWIWIEDEFLGLARINIEKNEVVYFSTSEENPHYISHNLVHCFTTDKLRRIWIGTEAGITIYDPVLDVSELCRYDLSNPKGLNTDPVYDAFCDVDGNIWLGTYFGGVNFWRANDSFFQTWESGSGKWQLGGNVVSCFEGDKKGNLWIGLEDLGLNYLNRESGELKKYTSDKGNYGLSYNNLHDLLLVDENKLWIASYTGGINILDIKSGQFKHIKHENTPQLNSNVIYKLLQVGDSIFIGTSLGVNVFNLKTEKFSQFKQKTIGSIQFEGITETQNNIWFSSVSAVYSYDKRTNSIEFFDRIPNIKNINFVKADSKNNIWIGDCYEGIACYNIELDSVTIFNKKNGFPASWIFSIEEGEDGWYWASSDKGLIKFHPLLGLNILYDSNSEVPFNQFNYRASFTDTDGNIYFGGNNGMVSFNESVNPMILQHTDVALTGFQLFNIRVAPGKDSPLKESINTIKKLILQYDQNVFTIEFSGLTYSLNGRCQYAYYLEGFESDWNYVGNRNFATYTNLSAGKYTFHVKGSTNNIFNETNERTFQIVVLPPFWLSKWAFLVYFFLAWVFSILLYRFGKYLEKSRAMVEMERREKEHAEEIHKVKLEFFTNVSHELKTPLTLILGPLNKIIDEEKLSPASQKRLFGIEKNARRLFNLIDQLLEFRKIENGKEKLKIVCADVHLFGEEIAKAFENIVDSKDIELISSFPEPGKIAWIDYNKVDKIILNLLSNAFKYTPAGGKIEFDIKLVKKNQKSRNVGNNLIIKISDTGKGIKPEMIDKVFDRFFQIEDETTHLHSSGIGLAYVKNLVALHGGEVRVESEKNIGTCFTVILPASKTDYKVNDIQDIKEQGYQREKSELQIPEIEIIDNKVDITGLSRNPIIMLVEDNKELIDFMKEILESQYQIMLAYNGKEALEKIEKIIPDLVISDIMMPVMDGLEFTKLMKLDLKTSHIPIVLLSAKSGFDNQLKGLNQGADYYIEKPFSPSILEKNIENILSTRKQLIERFKKDDFITVGEVASSESDKIFMENLTAIIKNNINDSSMDVTFLVKTMGLSRSLLHMKLKGLVNCSTTEFMRAVRLKEAVKLIASGKCNISEAAYETGFSSPTYFARRFKEYYGKSPRDYFNMKN